MNKRVINCNYSKTIIDLQIVIVIMPIDRTLFNRVSNATPRLLWLLSTIFTHVTGRHFGSLKQNTVFFIKTESNSQRTGLVHQYDRRFFVLEHQHGRRDVT